MTNVLTKHRLLGPIWALAVLAVVCLCLGSLLLTLDYRTQLSETRSQLAQTRSADAAAQQATFRACLRRNDQRKLIDALERADVVEQLSLIKIQQNNVAVAIEVRTKLINAFHRKLAADRRYLSAPPIDCSSQRPQIVTSSSRGR